MTPTSMRMKTLPYKMAAPPEKRDTRPPLANPTPEQRRRLNAPPAYDDTETSYAHYALLCGEGVHNVTIEGAGEIDGNRPRRGGPKPIAFKNSEWISIRGITIRNAPNYNISLMGTDHVEVEGVKAAERIRRWHRSRQLPLCPDHQLLCRFLGRRDLSQS